MNSVAHKPYRQAEMTGKGKRKYRSCVAHLAADSEKNEGVGGATNRGSESIFKKFDGHNQF